MEPKNPAPKDPISAGETSKPGPFDSLNPTELRRLLRERSASEGDVTDLVAQMNAYLDLVDDMAVSLSVMALVAERMAIKHGVVTMEEIANLRVGE